MTDSRIIVKNLPKHLTLDRFKAHFAVKGDITDARIMHTERGRNRMFGFIGYRSKAEAENAVQYFNKTYIDTSRINVELARPVGDQQLPRPWSRHSKAQVQPNKVNEASAEKEQLVVDNSKNKEEEVDEKLMEFLGTMKPRSQTKLWQNDDGPSVEAGNVGVAATLPKDEDDELYEDLPSMVKPSTSAVEDHEPEVRLNSSQQEPSDADASANMAKSIPDIIADSGRLFVRNLPYTCSQEDLEAAFKEYGPVTEVQFPLTADKRPKGFAVVTFMIPGDAIQAYFALDKTIFQGRLLHILPAKEAASTQEEQQIDGSFKTKKEGKLKTAAMDEKTWNTLFMSSDAVADYMANKFKTEKGDILNPEADNLAVRMAVAETHVINETTKYLESQGVNLKALRTLKSGCKRSDTVIVVKNIPFSATSVELSNVFCHHGQITRLVLPPTHTIAFVEFGVADEAKAAFTRLAFKNFKGKPLMLEMAPEGIISEQSVAKAVVEVPLPASADSVEEISEGFTTLYLKNLNFNTTESGFESCFRGLEGFRSCKICWKPDPKNAGKKLSMGFGFAEFESKDFALKAMSLLQNSLLDGHALQVSVSDRSKTQPTSTSKDVKKAPTTKIIIRNVPFEATRQDLKQLFSTFGQIKSLRLPKKQDHRSHRGFAFIDFLTSQEAQNAYDNLRNTHLYGRHLVMEWAESDKSIEDLRTKTKRQLELLESADQAVNKAKRMDEDLNEVDMSEDE